MKRKRGRRRLRPLESPERAMAIEDEEEAQITPSVMQKRQRLSTGSGLITPLDSETGALTPQYDLASDDSEDSDYAAPTRASKKITRALSHVDLPGWDAGPAYPMRLYDGWEPPADRYTEHTAVSRLQSAFQKAYPDASSTPEYTFFELNAFCVYRPVSDKRHSLELVTLDKLSRDRFAELRFEGVLCFGEHKYFVEDVPFKILTVDGYGDDDPEAADMAKQLCVQSPIAQRQDVWYRLGTPAPEYRRFYKPFLWLARFTKYYVDYLLSTESVTIEHFRHRFFDWLQAGHSDDKGLRTWLATSGLRDFRTTVASNIEYLWKECYGTADKEDEIDIRKQPIWGEVLHTELRAIREERHMVHATVVTPFANDCFRTMYFADQFVDRAITDPRTRDIVRQRKVDLGLTPLLEERPSTVLTPLSQARESPDPIGDVSPGDVVIFQADHESRWESEEDEWYAYVQRVWTDRQGEIRLDIIWLYHSGDTTLGKAYYPFQNELFFSDNCGCQKEKEAEYLGNVKGKVQVSWFASDPYAETGLFVRRKFRTVPEMDLYDFVSLKKSDFRCHHQDDHTHQDEPGDNSDIGVGDPIIYRFKNNVLAQVGQVLSLNTAHVRVRRLPQRCQTEAASCAKPNELVTSSDIITISRNNVSRKCHLRSFSREEIDTGRIPTPYDRDGAGDFFYTERCSQTNSSTDDNNELPPPNESWNPYATEDDKKLIGLGIFCGGGTFDRGLEEGGAVKFQYAVDWAQHALHSYRANLENPDEVKFFLGSVDDYLHQAMSGSDRVNIAQPGSINVISAGSPCQGFSRLQLSTVSEESKKNASMVASVVSFVDFYVPEYLVLENVVTMTEGLKERKEHNVFSQILAALVGLGYQVQQSLVDSWSHGSSQQRSRVFITISAPGLPPLCQPHPSHGHPPDSYRTRKLGKATNGLPFGTRWADPDVVFPHLTPKEAVKDLPRVFDSQPNMCTQFPDHRTATDEGYLPRTRMARVPTRPRGMTLMQAKIAGLLPRGSEAYQHCEKFASKVRGNTNSKMYARVFPDGLFPTIVTKLTVGDCMNGRSLHWDEHRVLTIMEARRAQGYLDHEVLVGNPSQQLKIVGNSVDRKSALVLGLSLRRSWMSAEDEFRSRTISKTIRPVVAAASNHAPHTNHTGSAAVSAFVSSSAANADTSASSSDILMMEDSIATPDEMENVESMEAIDNRTAKISLNLSQDHQKANEGETGSTSGEQLDKKPDVLADEYMESSSDDLESAHVDNRSVKIALLTQEEEKRVRKAGRERRGAFKEIIRILDSRAEQSPASDDPLSH